MEQFWGDFAPLVSPSVLLRWGAEVSVWVLGVLIQVLDTIFQAVLMADPTRDILETFDNPFPHRNFVVETIAPEFTSMCPKTGQPDFGTLTITYVADKVCYELKSLKMYLQQYRNHGAYYERVTNMILDDLVAVTQPRWMKIEAAFTPRGGIRTNVIVEHGRRPE